jgi:hypothetical protein
MDNIDKLPVTMEPAEQITGNMQYRCVESPLKKWRYSSQSSAAVDGRVQDAKHWG